MTPTVAYIVIPDYSSNIFCPQDPNARTILFKSKQDAEAVKQEGEKVVMVLVQID